MKLYLFITAAVFPTLSFVALAQAPTPGFIQKEKSIHLVTADLKTESKVFKKLSKAT